MTMLACRGHIRFVIASVVILGLLFLAYLLTDSSAVTRFDISSFPSEVLGKIRLVLNHTRMRDEPEKFPIILSHRDPSFSKYKPSDIIHVEITTSGESLGGAIAAMNSVHLNTKHPVRFHLFAPAGETVHHLANWISQTHLRDCDYSILAFNISILDGKIAPTQFRSDLASPMNFARFYTPLILKQQERDIKGKLVHLDDDVVVQQDIAQLWNQTVIDHKHWAAFSNECTGKPRHSIHSHLMTAFINFQSRHVKKLKIRAGTCAINTGVYVIDLFYWLRHNVTQQLDSWLILNSASKGDLFNHQRAVGYSGPPMMLVFHDKYREIDPLWHVRGLGETAGERYSKSFLENANLLHWSGVNKPWGRIEAAMGRDVWDTYYLPDPWHRFKVIRKAKSKSSRLDH